MGLRVSITLSVRGRIATRKLQSVRSLHLELFPLFQRGFEGDGGRGGVGGWGGGHENSLAHAALLPLTANAKNESSATLKAKRLMNIHE